MNQNTDENRWALADLATAITWAEKRRQQNIAVAVDPLGEYAQNAAQAAENLESYLHSIRLLRENACQASLAIKLSAIGLSFARQTTEEHLNTILELAKRCQTTVEIDIEGTPSVQAVCEIAQQSTREGFAPVLALQAYLDRTANDLQQSLQTGLKIRLVKGAYRGDTEDFKEVQQRFLTLFDKLLASGSHFDVGTHDPLLLKAMTARLGTHKRHTVCFGFLKGLAEQTKEQLAGAGYLVSEYVPFGSNRRAYVTRRKAYLQRLIAIGLEPAP